MARSLHEEFAMTALTTQLSEHATEVAQWYRMHFVTHGTYDLSQYFKKLRRKYPLRVLRTRRGAFRTIEMCLPSQELRALVSALPYDVLASYEKL